MGVSVVLDAAIDERLTAASIQAVVGARNLDSGRARVDDPVLSTSAVAVVAGNARQPQQYIFTSARTYIWTGVPLAMTPPLTSRHFPELPLGWIW